MNLIDTTGGSKVAARIRNAQERLKKHITVTVSTHGPESPQLTGALPKTRGWRVALDVPLFDNNRKDYVEYLVATKYKEIWVKVSTSGGRSKVYVR